MRRLLFASPLLWRGARVLRAGIYTSILTLGLASAGYAENAEKLYRSFCSSCHGSEMQGAMGPSLVDEQWLHGASDDEITSVIKNGVPKKGMPAWKKSLTDAQIRALVILMRERSYEQSASSQPEPNSGIYTAAGHSFSLKRVAQLPGQIWSMDFMPDGKMIVSQRDGQLWLVEDGRISGPIKDTPQVWHKGQGGLLEVALHPQYKQNDWIYLTLSDPDGDKAMTKLVRGKIKEGRWQNQQEIYASPSPFYSPQGVHFGSRIAFIGDDLYFTVGDRGQRDLAQDLAYPYGKIHRLKFDGSIPQDNPFVGQKNAIASIWSYGHRNPQGIAVHPISGDLWAAEHGPRGGDEINPIDKGRNYGWPVITYGMNYDGTAMTDKTHQKDMEQPVHYWVPSIAVSEIDFYTGDRFPLWHNHMLVGSLAKQELRLLTINGRSVISDQLLLNNLGRIRDLANGPDGYPYIVLNNQRGEIYRLEPVNIALSQ